MYDYFGIMRFRYRFEITEFVFGKQTYSSYAFEFVNMNYEPFSPLCSAEANIKIK